MQKRQKNILKPWHMGTYLREPYEIGLNHTWTSLREDSWLFISEISEVVNFRSKSLGHMVLASRASGCLF